MIKKKIWIFEGPKQPLGASSAFPGLAAGGSPYKYILKNQKYPCGRINAGIIPPLPLHAAEIQELFPELYEASKKPGFVTERLKLVMLQEFHKTYIGSLWFFL